jgi:hypothetical protein
VVSCYDDLHQIMRDRALELQLSREELDSRSGAQNGYSSKLLAPRPIRRASLDTLSFLLPALGLSLIVLVDETAKHGTRAPGRHGATVHFVFSARHMKQIQRKGGANSRKNLTPAKRRALARRAARARWQNGHAHHNGATPVR